MRSTPYTRLIEEKLRQAGRLHGNAGLNAWLHDRRTGDNPTPWRTIAAEIAAATGETPTDVTVATWYDEPKPTPEPPLDTAS